MSQRIASLERMTVGQLQARYAEGFDKSTRSGEATPENRKHQANADGLSPNAAINPEVRRVLRNRARAEEAVA